MKLFMEDPVEPGLVAEERAVAVSAGLPQQIQSVVEELVRGSEGELISPLSSETRVLDVFIKKDVAVVNLSREAVEQHSGGSISELLSVYALVDSITANFPAIQRVQIAIDGA
ncbi:MAG TPA: GerMN domain-containing protein, partial [Candidatus Krumholzibacteria bacterium]